MAGLQTTATDCRPLGTSLDGRGRLLHQVDRVGPDAAPAGRGWTARRGIQPQGHLGVPLRLGQFVGESAAMLQTYDHIARVAPTHATVLIVGETGTGKELVARALHDLSRHPAGPYVALNCASIAPSLIESELFGHERGSLTGAVR